LWPWYLAVFDMTDCFWFAPHCGNGFELCLTGLRNGKRMHWWLTRSGYAIYYCLSLCVKWHWFLLLWVMFPP